MRSDQTLKRLKTIEGHMRGVIRMVEEDSYCIDIIRHIEVISTANLTTAFEINSELIDQIKSTFELKTKNTIELTNNTDPSLIGGFIFIINGEQYDASIASRLSSVKKQLQLK